MESRPSCLWVHARALRHDFGALACVIVGISVLLTGAFPFPEGFFAFADEKWPLPAEGTPPEQSRRSDLDQQTPVQPWVLCRVPLEDASFYAREGLQPDTDVRFSADGRRLAIGSFLGQLIVVDVYAPGAGQVAWQRKVAEGMVKQVCFSPDGNVLYYGEQSVDGFVGAVDWRRGQWLWTFRLADELKAGQPVREEAPFAIYQLPGCYRLLCLKDGDLLVLGIHAWGEPAKREWMQRLSRVYRLSPQGQVRWAFPAEGPMPLTMPYLAADPEGKRVAVLVGSSAGNTPEQYPYQSGSLVVLDGKTGDVLGGHHFEPYRPWFAEVGFWHSVAVSADGNRASVGMFDGRTFVFQLHPVKVLREFAFGAPILISNIPVSAQATYTHLAPDGMAYFQTGNSSVPYASASQHVVSPPGPHPMANTLHAVSPEGEVRWRFRSGHEYQGFWTSSDGRWLATCVHREQKGIRDAGAMMFDTHRPGGSRKLLYFYQVSGLTFFRADMAPDGSAFAFTEVPYQDPVTEKLIGTYQVHIIR